MNPFGLSFMTGLGCATPVNVHHSLAQAAGINLVGAVVGGPTSMGVLTALNDALRAIVNEGAGIGAISTQLALLAGCGLVSFAAAVRMFRWQ